MLYAVGDIHGELRKLEELLRRLPTQTGDRFVFLGDYVDRGSDAAGVVSCLLEFSRHHECVFLMGNHESMFLDFLGWHGEIYFGGDSFLANGGDRTLASYGYFQLPEPAPHKLDLPPAHADFFRSLRLHYREGDYLFVHAGLAEKGLRDGDVDYALRRTRVEDLLWNRTIGDLPHNLGITLVYGHTPRADFSVRWNPPFSVGIDTGAVYGGPLTAIRLPDETLYQVY